MEAGVPRSDLISQEYIDINVRLHLKWPSYGASGSQWCDEVTRLGFADILDYGCGKGSLREALGSYVREYDPAIPGKNEPPDPADLVVCTDVLEHLEPEKLDTVLCHLRYLMKKKGFFVISTREAKKTLEDGRNAHLIIQNMDWWKKRLAMFFKIERLAEPKEGEFVVIVS